jgi:hypothetical protein
MGKIYDVGPRQTFTPLATGDYVLTLKEVGEHVEEEDSQYSKKGDVKIEWTWEIAVPDEEPATRRTRAAPPASWNEKSTFVKIAEALRLVDHERAVTEGAHIDWDKAIGKQIMGSILKLPKEGKPGEWTDNIKAFAPMPHAPTTTQAPVSGALRERYRALCALAGTSSHVADQANGKGLAEAMKALGAQPITADAKRQLAELNDTLTLVGAEPIDLAGIDSWTMRAALLAADKIEKAMPL